MSKSWKRKRIRKVGSVEDLQKKIWQSILECERIILEDDHTDGQKLQAVHGLNSSSKAYLKILEAIDIEERLTALEEKFQHVKLNEDEQSHW